MKEGNPQTNTEPADINSLEKEVKLPNVLLVSRCFIENTEKEILLLHRNDDRIYNPGKWELPGGKVGHWQDFVRATEEEVLDEVSLLVAINSKTAFVESKLVEHSVYSGMLYLELVFPAFLISGRVKISPDHQNYKWIKPEEALDLDLSIEARKAITFHMGLKIE